MIFVTFKECIDMGWKGLAVIMGTGLGVTLLLLYIFLHSFRIVSIFQVFIKVKLIKIEKIKSKVDYKWKNEFNGIKNK